MGSHLTTSSKPSLLLKAPPLISSLQSFEIPHMCLDRTHTNSVLNLSLYNYQLKTFVFFSHENNQMLVLCLGSCFLNEENYGSKETFGVYSDTLWVPWRKPTLWRKWWTKLGSRWLGFWRYTLPHTVWSMDISLTLWPHLVKLAYSPKSLLSGE